MKTNAALNTNTRAESSVLRKASINPELNPTKIISKKPASMLSIQGYELKQWLQHLNSSDGVYFIDSNGHGQYSLHFKHHGTGQLMELEPPKREDISALDGLKALLFDLSLFPDAPILAFNADLLEIELKVSESLYHEHTQEIEIIIGRMVNVDMKSLFKNGIYHEPRVKQFTIDDIYQAFFPGTSRSFKEQGSYGMYLIFLAVQNIFYQIIGNRITA